MNGTPDTALQWLRGQTREAFGASPHGLLNKHKALPQFDCWNDCCGGMVHSMSVSRFRARLVGISVLCSFAACTFSGTQAFSQATAPSDTASTYAYTSASVQPSSTGMPGGGFRVSNTALESVNTTLSDLIQFAYELNAGQILNAPAWAGTDQFDLSLVFPGDLPNDAQCKAMVRKALAERFQLTSHRASGQMAVYRLRTALTDVKLAGSLGDPDGLPGLHLANPGKLEARNASIADLASTLQRSVLDRPVLDESGLSGRYDFTLLWTPVADGLKGSREGIPAADALLPLNAALSQQLGLTLEASIASPKTLVVDHVEKPLLH